MEASLIEAFLGYVDDGGFVMPPLVVATVVLWFALGWRWMTLRRGSKKELRELVAASTPEEATAGGGIITRAVHIGLAIRQLGVDDTRGYLKEAFGGLRDEMKRFEKLVAAIVAAAPLAGLLGTVTGMIETFDALQSMSLFTQSGGVAGGISVALISTQMGLVVAVPGLLVGRMLDRRQERLDQELDQLEELLST
ncbi:MAG: MotA/TolQ/ExbB proton channel family protein [Persicimonas sp.]